MDEMKDGFEWSGLLFTRRPNPLDIAVPMYAHGNWKAFYIKNHYWTAWWLRAPVQASGKGLTKEEALNACYKSLCESYQKLDAEIQGVESDLVGRKATLKEAEIDILYFHVNEAGIAGISPEPAQQGRT